MNDTLYTVYKITNTLSGKSYIGTHKTKDLNDNYMGSGSYLNRSQKKNGIENFSKEILFIFDNPEEMYSKEAELVNEDFVAAENTYNLKVGGLGGWDYVNNNNLGVPNFIDKPDVVKRASKTGNIILREKSKDIEWRKKYNKNISIGLKNYFKSNPGPFSGKKHSEATKDKMSSLAKIRLKDPKNNSQYGTIWITDGNENRKIKSDTPIPNGFRKGRIIKHLDK